MKEQMRKFAVALPPSAMEALKKRAAEMGGDVTPSALMRRAVFEYLGEGQVDKPKLGARIDEKIRLGLTNKEVEEQLAEEGYVMDYDYVSQRRYWLKQDDPSVLSDREARMDRQRP